MKAEAVEFQGRHAIEGYGPGFFRIAGALWRGPVLVGPEGVRAWENAPDFAPLLEAEAEILVIGCGVERAGFDLAPLEAAGFGVECLPTPAACRTFNVLLTENRLALAALIPV